MKKVIQRIVLTLLFCALSMGIVYGGFAFTYWNTDPNTWEENDRFMCCLWVLGLWIVSIIGAQFMWRED